MKKLLTAARAHVMIPLRIIAENLGFTVTWDNGVVTVTGPERYAQLKVENGVTMKGENGLFMAAIWARGGYTYAITARAGMGAADMAALIQSVN